MIQENPEFALVHPETRALQEITGPQELLDIQDILENRGSLGLQDRKAAKEIQDPMESRGNQV